MTDFSTRVRAARDKRSISANELDRRIGKGGQGYTSRLESSKRTPRVDTAKLIADALGVRLEWLVTGEGPRDISDLDQGAA